MQAEWGWWRITAFDCTPNRCSKVQHTYLLQVFSALNLNSIHIFLINTFHVNRFPDLRLNLEPASLPEEVRSPPRASCYDNVHDLRPLSEQVKELCLTYQLKTIPKVLKTANRNISYIYFVFFRNIGCSVEGQKAPTVNLHLISFEPHA